MGEVWRATDSHLGRQVALKLLPEAFTRDAERSARFEREARVLASLNHPNIAQIYGLQIEGEVRALVMEIVEGPTLADRLSEGRLGLDESLAIAHQIAEALEEAHEKGIVHRDLKPQNVKVTPAGKVKVLDFGLAKAMDPASTASGSAPSSQLAQSPTLSLGATQMGVVLGTAAYMAPEQAKGMPADKRADVWAFGVVLYEMLCGRRLFEGDSVPETLAGVLKSAIDLEALPAGVPPAIRQLLRRCLERNPKNRLHDVADARLVIDDVMAGRSDEHSPAAVTPTAPGSRPLRGWLMLAAIALALALGAAADRFLHAPAAERDAAGDRWALALPEDLALSTIDTPQIAISRDGRLQAVVVVDRSGASQILLRRSDEFEPRRIAGTEGALAPFFSPDGEWIGFLRDDALMKIPTAGGPAIRLATVVTGGRGATWADDGYIYFPFDFNTPLQRVAATGGQPQPVTKLDKTRSERTHRWPDALPGGDAVLFTSDTQASTEYYDDARIEVVRPSTGDHKVLVEGASEARFAPGGFMVFARGGSLYALRFDARTLTVSGTPQEVATGVATDVGSGAAQFAIAASGAAVWSPGGVSASYRIVWVDRDGRETPVPLPAVPYQELALSPDGRKLALIGGQGGVSDLWVADLERGGLTRLSSGKFLRDAVWAPDGARIAYGAFGPGETEADTHLEWLPADGSRPAERLPTRTRGTLPSAFSPDGRSLLFDSYFGDQGRVTIARLSLDAAQPASEARVGMPLDTFGVLSPDGKWLAYVSIGAGQDSVYVRPYPQGEGRWQVSVPMGDEPRWSPDGRALYFRTGSVLYRVPIDTSRGFSAGRPEAVLDRVASGQRVCTYSFSPDGARIVTFRAPPGSGAQRTVNLDLGFAQRLAGLRTTRP